MTEFISIHRLLVDKRHPAAPVASRHGHLIRFSAFRTRTAAYASYFASHPAANWALHYEDSLEFACALLGAWHAGKCVTLPADALPATTERLRAAACALAGSFPAADLAEDTPLPAADFLFAELDHDRHCLTLYTSGSSGEPCAINKRLEQLTSEIATLARQWSTLPAHAHILATVSHQHIYGLLFKLLWPLSSGRPFACERLVFPEQMAQRLAQAPCVLVSSPAHLKRLPPHLPWQAAASCLAGIFTSGGPLPAAAVDDCLQLFGRAPWEVYGSSETGGIAWRERSADKAARWQLLAGINARVMINDQLAICSPHLENPASWYPCDDLARLHPDGLELLGRSDRIAKLEEKRISLTQVENALLQTGWFEEVRALLLDGERIRLAVATAPNAAGWQQLDALGKRAFNDRLRQGLGLFLPEEARPRHWRHLWALPHNSQGKLRDSMLSPWFDASAPVFRVRELSTDSARVELETPAGSPYFDGHFPGRPILPGVAQLEWVIRIADVLFAPEGTFRGLKALKFQQPILPGTLLQLQLDMDRRQGQLQFSLNSPAGQHASGRIAFTEAACAPVR